ncbi:MAG TPA: hypothetical protein DCM87_09320 [Planctomycetes bacterium]|nr:hypothetical protein [Planctomycetota bacterium]
MNGNQGGGIVLPFSPDAGAAARRNTREAVTHALSARITAAAAAAMPAARSAIFAHEYGRSPWTSPVRAL